MLAGRAPLYGAAVAGEAGARFALDVLRRELELTLGMIGCPTVAGLNRGFVRGAEPIEVARAPTQPTLLTVD